MNGALASGLLFLILQLWVAGPAVAADAWKMPGTPDPVELSRVRTLYFEAVQDGDALDRAEREVERLLEAGHAGPRLTAVLTAYEGALRTLRAKHGRWPHARLRDLQSGLRILDEIVGDHPDLVEPRYLRLMSCYYLPGFLGRGGSVREDFTELARLLPHARSTFPAEIFEAVAGFVLENGDLPADLRSPLERSLGR